MTFRMGHKIRTRRDTPLVVRKEVVQIRLTPAEKKIVKLAAEDANTTLSDYIRLAVSEYITDESGRRLSFRIA